ncbi:MAG TPA: peptidase inhibitor family I36 protein, partial [Kofleriaceae bacterium]
MQNRNWKSVLFKLALVGVAAGGPVVLEHAASAAASCAGAGFLCFYDYGTGQYGNVEDNNPDWREFGWNDRADIFKNDGRFDNVCVYQDINYRTYAWFIARDSQWWDVPDNT